MIDMLAFVAVLILAAHSLCLLVWGWRLLRLFPRPGVSAAVGAPEERPLPRAVVLMAVRGADPSLGDCLDGLLRQNYPGYEVCVILDSREDPAFEVIAERSAAAGGLLRVHVLTEPRQTCSLKLSALLHAIGELDSSPEILALIDQDVVPHADWLRDLARPLGDQGVGATTGIRWYSPRSAGWGGLVRFLWNGGACLHMFALHIPWGGSLAMRLDVLRRSDLLEKWSRSLFEDVACYDSLRRLGLRVQVVPQAAMVNRETIDLKGCFHFIRRQLLDARLYHSRWGTVLTLACVSTATQLLCAGLAVLALAEGDGWLGAALFVYFVSLFILLFCLQRRIDPQPHRRAVGPIRFWGWTLVATPLAQAVYFASLVSACVVRRVVWRGIAYTFDGPFSVRLVRYQPYSAAAENLPR